MKEEKSFFLEQQEQGDLSATRAKNKTMMLSPELTSKVRHQVLSELQGLDMAEKGDQITEPTRRITVSKESLLKVPQPDKPNVVAPQPGNPRVSYTAFQTEETKHSVEHHHDLKPHLKEEKPLVHEQHDANVVFSYKTKKGKLVGFLITYHFNPEGEFFPLYEGRMIVTRKGDRNDTNQIIIKDETVDVFHAILKILDGKILVLDQLSDNGTKLRKTSGEVLNLCGDKAEAESRDRIIFGEVEFIALLI